MMMLLWREVMEHPLSPVFVSTHYSVTDLSNLITGAAALIPPAPDRPDSARRDSRCRAQEYYNPCNTKYIPGVSVCTFAALETSHAPMH